MSYEPKEWTCGETITADALNNIEEGIQDALEGGGGGSSDFIITITYSPDAGGFVMDKTLDEIEAAYAANKTLKIRVGDDYATLEERTESMGGVTYRFALMVHYRFTGNNTVTIGFEVISIQSPGTVNQTYKRGTIEVS